MRRHAGPSFRRDCHAGPDQWRVIDRECNYSAFSGRSYTPSDYSSIVCLEVRLPLAHQGQVCEHSEGCNRNGTFPMTTNPRTMNMRRVRDCGGCTFCCHSMPIEPEGETDLKPQAPTMVEWGWLTRRDVRQAIPDFGKPGDCDCPHQRNGRGCAIYSRRPLGCRLWSCMWALDRLASEFARPDEAGYAIDPNLIEGVFSPRDGEAVKEFQCVMFWCDWTRIEEIKSDPQARTLMHQIALRGYPSLLRAGDPSGGKCVVIFPPPIGEWTERRDPGWMTKEQISNLKEQVLRA